MKLQQFNKKLKELLKDVNPDKKEEINPWNGKKTKYHYKDSNGDSVFL